MLIDIIPFVLASVGFLVLSYVTTVSGGSASPGLGGQHTPRGKGMGKDMGFPPGALPGETVWKKVTFLTCFRPQLRLGNCQFYNRDQFLAALYMLSNGS